jgi:alcohol dehydrogenase (cytochrome c)
VTRDALYTDSTLAIDPDTGKLVWHFQHQPNDQWDLDWALEQVLFKLPGTQKTLLATAGKQAIYDVLEADTGKYVFSIDLGLQDVVTAIDPKTGAKTIDPSKIPGRDKTVSVCPHSGGAKSWIPESYNPTTRTLFVPLNESCMDLVPVPSGGRTMLSSGVRWRLRPRPNSDGKYGRLQAINLDTRKVAWTMRQRVPIVAGTLATAGGVVFVGSLDRVFAAYDDANGRELWRVRLNDVPNAAPITFLASGRQYVALTVGNGGPMTRAFPMLVPEVKNPPEFSAALYVFELPER